MGKLLHSLHDNTNLDSVTSIEIVTGLDAGSLARAQHQLRRYKPQRRVVAFAWWMETVEIDVDSESNFCRST